MLFCSISFGIVSIWDSVCHIFHAFPMFGPGTFLCSRIQINMATAVLRQSNGNSLRKWVFYFILFIFFSQLFEKIYFFIIQLFEFRNFTANFFLPLNCKTAYSFYYFNNYIVVTIFNVSIRISFDSFPYTLLMVSVVKNFKSKRNNKTENDASRKMVEFWSFSNFYNAFRFLNIVFPRFSLLLFLSSYSVTVNLI